jgi:hypothetical protein
MTVFRGQAEDIDIPILAKNPTRPILTTDEILCCLEFDTESTIGTCKDVSALVDCERNGFIHMDTAPTSAAWRGMLFWAATDGLGLNQIDNLCLKVKLVTGGDAAAELTCSGIETADKLLGVFHISTAAQISTIDDITHLCSIPAAGKIACTFATTSDHLLVFYHDVNGSAGIDVPNLRFALIDGTTVDTDIACADVNSNAIAVADSVLWCGHITTKATVASIADLTSECHATHTAGSVQMETTDTSNDLLWVIWNDVA